MQERGREANGQFGKGNKFGVGNIGNQNRVGKHPWNYHKKITNKAYLKALSIRATSQPRQGGRFSQSIPITRPVDYKPVATTGIRGWFNKVFGIVS